MSLPFTLPPWLPWWVTLLILVPSLLYGLVLFIMPFNVIGLKGRLDTLDARLDEIQGEIRSLVLRLPEPMRAGRYEDTSYAAPPGAVTPQLRDAARSEYALPPIPPAAEEPGRGALRAPMTTRGGARREPERSARPSRSEPRLDRPY